MIRSFTVIWRIGVHHTSPPMHSDFLDVTRHNVVPVWISVMGHTWGRGIPLNSIGHLRVGNYGRTWKEPFAKRDLTTRKPVCNLSIVPILMLVFNGNFEIMGDRNHMKKTQHRILPKDDTEDAFCMTSDFFLLVQLVPKIRQKDIFSSAPAEQANVPSGETARWSTRPSCA